jgi:hypothetical protein
VFFFIKEGYMCWFRKKPWWDRVIAEIQNDRKTLLDRQFTVRGLYDWAINHPCFEDDAHRRVVVGSLISGLEKCSTTLKEIYWESVFVEEEDAWFTPAAEELHRLCGRTLDALKSLLITKADCGGVTTADLLRDCP